MLIAECSHRFHSQQRERRIMILDRIVRGIREIAAANGVELIGQARHR